MLDVWYGVRDWVLDYFEDSEVWIIRKEYEEKGGEYFKEYCVFNIYVFIRLFK